MNIKELINNEELISAIVEDIEDIPEDSEVTYEVWALGYTNTDEVTDAEVLLGEFADPTKAVAFAEQVTFETIQEKGLEKPFVDVAYFSIEVETVVEDLEDEDCGTMNIGTIYRNELWIKAEDIQLAETDYTLLEDGTLKVSCKLLKGFNKNDTIKVKFIDENNEPILTYKIISKVMYADGDYYHCEFIY
jgi:hypothetical protein